MFTDEAGRVYGVDGIINFMNDNVFNRDIAKHANLFNQYNQSHPHIDKPNAHMIRRKNLLRYVRQLQQPIRNMFIGIAPGYAGCRFSGIPFTSEHKLIGNNKADFFDAGYEISSNVALKPEMTATKLWTILDEVDSRILSRTFMWNLIPYHPHEGDDPLTNRDPSKEEIEDFKEICQKIVEMLKPKNIITFGRTPERILTKILGREVTYVKHPSRASYSALNKVKYYI